MTTRTQSTTQLTIERCADPDEWNAFVEANDGSPFSLWEWGDAVETYGHSRWYLAARRDGRIVGVLPLVHMQSLVFRSKLVSPPFGERGSVVLADDEDDATAELLLGQTKELADDLDVDFVSLRGGNVGETAKTATETVAGENSEFEQRTRFVTFRVDTSRETEAVRDGIKESRQRQIRQAAESDLTHAVGESVADLREFYRLYLETMRGHGSPPHSFEFFETLWNDLADAGRFRLEMLRKDGELVNAIVNLALGSTVYQWKVANDYEHRELNGGSLLVWKSLEWTCENGFDAYEFGRTREGSGVYMFKKSFGGAKTWYDDLHYFPDSSGSLPHPDDEKYDQLKEVWSRLPIPVTRLVGPRLRKDVSL